jgi:hypothetical protein
MLLLEEGFLDHVVAALAVIAVCEAPCALTAWPATSRPIIANWLLRRLKLPSCVEQANLPYN